ncbi:MAG: valine--tRNA ligase [Anaerovoracaceae bacterium]|jgi:valyl-tRNA synthetase
MKKNLAKTYDPKDFEDRIYREWEEGGMFRAERDPDKEPFTIVMPPPNITGKLHMGHALDQTLQDVLIRWKRMQGYSALWLPGSDHASIATEVKVVNRLKERGIEKHELGREKFLEEAWKWKEEFGGKITEQCRKLGDSCDWSRERFTMDEGCSNAVKTFFINLYKKGYIYRGNRLVNWCPDCATTLSDIEVEHEDMDGEYWYFRYPGADGGEGIVVATSRPETMFTDVAVAVNPSDERYKDMVGKKVMIPLLNKEIPVIEDPYPDPEKGTGAVKITPAHDPNDFEVGQRHDLPCESCMNMDATMNENAGKYEGMDRYECRKAWVADLDAAGYLVKTEKMSIPVGTCYRCHTAVEPMLSEQWFVKMDELAKPAIRIAKDKELIHVPERFEKTYLYWLENIRDWCISRQLWWGHRIPAYYCDDCGEMTVAPEAPEKCPKCGSTNLRQDEDVLDTWFSSALWPFSTLGWPEETEDLKYFYPTSVLVTGYDILFFWVIRMTVCGMEAMGETPFKYVYLHGLVRDAQGRKMSKSLGNGIDPLEMIDKYGADALRFMLMSGVTPGNDMRFQIEKLEWSRNFANKLWNASRFAIMNLQDDDGNFLETADPDSALLKDEDKWMISRVNEAAKTVTEQMDKFELSLAVQSVYELIWNEFCDWYIEIVKGRLYGDDEEDKKVARMVLLGTLKDMLRLLHPFMPFITEEIWSVLPHDRYLIQESWPEYDPARSYPEEEAVLGAAMSAVKAVRNIRAEADAAPKKALSAIVMPVTGSEETVKKCERYIADLANITAFTYVSDKADVPEEVMSAVTPECEIFIPLEELVDMKAEYERLKSEEKRLEGEVKRAEGKLSNRGFTEKAPEKIVNEEREKLVKYRDMLEKVRENIAIVEKKI